MSLLDSLGVTPAFKAVSRCTNNYFKAISDTKFANADLKEKLLRTVVAVGAISLGVMACKFGFPLAAQAVINAPAPLFFSAIAVIGVPFTAGLSLILFIPIAVYSMPILIQTAGAALALAVGAASTGLAAKSFSFI